MDLVGHHPDPEMHRLQADPHVQVHANPDTLTHFYARAHIVVVPLRVGGGTRMILEAAAHGVPVVSTSVGARGLDLYDEVDLLLADTDDGLVQACARLITAPGLASGLSAHAAAAVR